LFHVYSTPPPPPPPSPFYFSFILSFMLFFLVCSLPPSFLPPCHPSFILAHSYGALILALEHRYYGASVPTKDFSNPNMVYLSSQQALADIVTFYAFMVKEYALTSDNRWVTFGGSYPGMLAAWARLKYPNLIYGAVASSAPVWANTNFQGYNDVVAASMAATDVGGSMQCADSIQTAFTTIGEQLGTSDGRRELEQLFNLCDENALEDTNNQRQFTMGLSELFPVQENDPACTSTACNISGCCQFMLDASQGAPEERLAMLSSTLNGGNCLNANYDQLVALLSDPGLVAGRGRPWFYQTCTEFAFYQTCDPGSQCIFTTSPHLNTLQSYYDLCGSAFGIAGSDVQTAVDFTNLVYGGNQTASSRIYFVNGEIDPWHAASVLEDLSAEEQALWYATPSSPSFLFLTTLVLLF